MQWCAWHNQNLQIELSNSPFQTSDLIPVWYLLINFFNQGYPFSNRTDLETRPCSCISRYIQFIFQNGRRKFITLPCITGFIRASNSPALRGSLPPGHYFSRSPGKHVKSPTSMKKNPAKHVKSPASVRKKKGNNCLANFQCNPPKIICTYQFRFKKDMKSSILWLAHQMQNFLRQGGGQN